MMMKKALETSIIMLSSRSFRRTYLFLGNKIAEIYRKSYICRLINSPIEPVYLSYNFSFLKELIGAIRVLGKGSPVFFYTSRSIQWIKNSYRKLKIILIGNSGTSLSGNLTKDIGREFGLSAVKSVSTVLIISIAVNFILILVFRKESNMKVSFILGASLVAGLLGLLCDADWETVKRESIVLRILFR